jgi:hypothetical protein
MLDSGRWLLTPTSTYSQLVSWFCCLELHLLASSCTCGSRQRTHSLQTRMRPTFTVHSDTPYYIRDKYVRACDLNSGSDIGLLSVRKFCSLYVLPWTPSFNPAERTSSPIPSSAKYGATRSMDPSVSAPFKVLPRRMAASYFGLGHHPMQSWKRRARALSRRI